MECGIPLPPFSIVQTTLSPRPNAKTKKKTKTKKKRKKKIQKRTKEKKGRSRKIGYTSGASSVFEEDGG